MASDRNSNSRLSADSTETSQRPGDSIRYYSHDRCPINCLNCFVTFPMTVELWCIFVTKDYRHQMRQGGYERFNTQGTIMSRVQWVWSFAVPLLVREDDFHSLFDACLRKEDSVLICSLTSMRRKTPRREKIRISISRLNHFLGLVSA